MATKSDSSKTILSEEESAKQLGLQYNLKQTEIKTLIEYYKRKDPDNKGLLPHQFKTAAGEFIASGLTLDPITVFNIFDKAAVGVHGRVTLREFVLGYAILARGTTDSRLRYLFSLYGSNKNSSVENDVANDFLTRDQLIQCLKFLQRVVSEVSDNTSEEDIENTTTNEDEEQNIHQVADNLIKNSTNPKSDTLSFTDFIDQLKETDVIVPWLDKLSNVAGEHLKYIEKKEREVVELHMEREGFLNVSASLSRSPSYAQDMDWTPAPISPDSPTVIESKSDTSCRTNSSYVEKRRRIPMPRKQKIVRRDGLHRSPSEIDNTKYSTNRKKHQKQKSLKQPLEAELQKGDQVREAKESKTNNETSNENSVNDEDDEEEEINAAKPFLINYKDIKIGKMLGRGACATVYEGTWLHIPVAVKVFHDGAGEAANIERLGTTDEERRKAIVGDYVEEFWLLLQIRHPNCLLYMGICFEPFVCIVTELFSGGSIANYLHGAQVQKFSPTKAIEMISGVARGMYYLHASNPPILHRDLKASNILINRHATHCVICDFGLSKQFVNEASGLRVNGENSSGPSKHREGGSSGRNERTIGTPYTMAPEIIELREYTPASDVYSFAIVMYEMYTGKFPFPGLKPIQLMFQVAQGKRPSFEENDNIPPNLRKLIEKCWSQNPEERPDFGTILNDLLSTELDEEVKVAQQKWLESGQKSISNNDSAKELSKLLLNAAFHNRPKELLNLINRGADVNYYDYDKRTALHVAAAEGHIDCIKTLVDAGALLTVDRWNNTAVVDANNYAQRTGYSEPAIFLRGVEGRALLSKNIDCRIEEPYSEKETYRTFVALDAAQKGNRIMLKRLLDGGLDVNICDYDRRTPLMVAASEGRIDVVNMLLAHGANVRHRDRWGNLALHEAERGGYHNIVRSLMHAEERLGSLLPLDTKRRQW